MKRIAAWLLAALLVCGVAWAEEAGEALPAMESSLEEWYETHEAETEEVESTQPFVPEGMDKVIIGADDRVTINNTSVYPYSTIGYMFVHATCGCDWSCTCFMVGPSGAMTAAHCLVCSEHGGTADRLDIYFGYVSSKNYLYHYTNGTTYWYGTSFKNEDGTYSYSINHQRWDYAYIKLQERVGDYTGWLGTRAALDSDADSYFELAGYKDNQLKSDWGRLTKLSDNPEYRFGITADALPGNSGSPVFDSDYYALCIWTSYNETRGENYVRRITGDLLGEMRRNGIFD